MALNDKLKGSYYRNYQATLASRTNVYNIINELKSYYENLLDLINNTNTKITESRTNMREKLNSILLKINEIQYNLNNFEFEIDSSLTEKLNKLMENYNTDFTDIVNQYDTNLYNHAKLEDQIVSNDFNYSQDTSEYEMLVERTNSDLGVRWFGGKFNDRTFLNSVNSLLNIVKYNSYDGISDEDYINSNLILDLFIYSTKGLTWLKLGKNSKFGYNIYVKYHSLRDTSLKITMNSNNYYNQKSYNINKFDLNMLLNLGYTESDLSDNNIYIKIKTNIPSNSYSGLDEYYVSGTNSLNEYNNKRVIGNVGKRHVAHNNRDYAYKIGNYSSLTEFRNKNKISDRDTDYISDFSDKNYDKSNTFTNNIFDIFSEISIVKDSSNKNMFKETIKRSSDNKDIKGLSDSVGAIVVDELSETDYKKSYIGDSTDLSNNTDENQNILYSDKSQRVNLLNYRNIGTDLGLLTQNENTFVVSHENESNNSALIVGNDRELEKMVNPALINDVTNNTLLDITTNNDFTETPTKINNLNLLGYNSFDKIIKKDILSNGDLILLVKNTVSGNSEHNGFFIIVDKSFNSVVLTKNDESGLYINYYDFLQLKDGTLYLFGSKGIQYINKDHVENHEYENNIQESNIVSGNFVCAHLNKDKTSFYAINNNGTIVEDTVKNNGVLTQFFYIYDSNTTKIKDLKDYCIDNNIDDSIIRDTDKTKLETFVNSDSGYKIIHWINGNRWLILHKDSGKVYISKDEKFGNFSINDKISEKINKVELFCIDSDNGNIYLAGTYDSNSEDAPEMFQLTVENGENTISNVKKAYTYTENNLTKFIRNTQLDCGTNMTGLGLTAVDIANESQENLTYRGLEPLKIDGIMYVPNKDITDIVDINGYYYILVPTGNVIYKINHERTLVGQIDLKDIVAIGTDETNEGILMIGYNNTLLLLLLSESELQDQIDENSRMNILKNSFYTEKESLKTNNTILKMTELENEKTYNIITNNKIIPGIVVIGGGLK